MPQSILLDACAGRHFLPGPSVYLPRPGFVMEKVTGELRCTSKIITDLPSRTPGEVGVQTGSDIGIWKARIPDGCAILFSLKGALLTQVELLPSLGRPQCHILF